MPNFDLQSGTLLVQIGGTLLVISDINYLLARIGFEKGDFLDQYLDSLYSLATQYRYLAAKEAVLKSPDEDSETDSNQINNPELVPLNPDSYKEYEFDGNVFVPTSFSKLDYLMFEYKSKKEKNVRKIQKENSLISATDLANFTYCPVSYSIGKTFETDIIRSAVVGSKFHAENKLVNWIRSALKGERTKEQKNEVDNFENEQNKYFFDDIRGSQIIYSGHTNNAKKYFINKKGNFTGQPDYVFKNRKGENFIVEEKFKWKKEETVDGFFQSHKVQLASYIYGLDEFDASYGYLIYWHYNFDTASQENKVLECKVLKISKSIEIQSFLRDTFLALSNLIREKKQNFIVDKLNPKKCANCAVNRFCGHKTGRFKDLEVPYNEKYLQLVSVPYPEELKKAPADIVHSSVTNHIENNAKFENLKDLLNGIDWDS